MAVLLQTASSISASSLTASMKSNDECRIDGLSRCFEEYPAENNHFTQATKFEGYIFRKPDFAATNARRMRLVFDGHTQKILETRLRKAFSAMWL